MKSALKTALNVSKLGQESFDQEDWFIVCSLIRNAANKLPILHDTQRYATRLSDMISSFFAGTTTLLDIPDVYRPYYRNSKSIETVLLETLSKHITITANIDNSCKIYVNEVIASRIHLDWHKIPVHNNQSFASLFIHLAMCCSYKPLVCKCSSSTQTDLEISNKMDCTMTSISSTPSTPPANREEKVLYESRIRQLENEFFTQLINKDEEIKLLKAEGARELELLREQMKTKESDTVMTTAVEIIDEDSILLRVIQNLIRLLVHISSTYAGAPFLTRTRNANVNEIFSLTVFVLNEIVNLINEINSDLSELGYVYYRIEGVTDLVDFVNRAISLIEQETMNTHTIASHLDATIFFIQRNLLNKKKMTDLISVLNNKVNKISNTTSGYVTQKRLKECLKLFLQNLKSKFDDYKTSHVTSTTNDDDIEKANKKQDTFAEEVEMLNIKYKECLQKNYSLSELLKKMEKQYAFDNDNNIKRLADCVNKLAAVKAEKDKVEKENKLNADIISDYDAEIQKLNEKLLSCKRELSECLSCIDEKNEKIKKSEEQIKDLDETLNSREALLLNEKLHEKDKLRAENLEYLETVRKQSCTISNLQNNIIKAVQELHDVEQKYIILKAQFDEDVDQLQTTKRNIDDTEIQEFEMEKNVQSLEANVENVEPLSMHEIKILKTLDTNMFARMITQKEQNSYIKEAIRAVEKLIIFLFIDLKRIPLEIFESPSTLNSNLKEMKDLIVNPIILSENDQRIHQRNSYIQLKYFRTRLLAELHIREKNTSQRKKIRAQNIE